MKRATFFICLLGISTFILPSFRVMNMHPSLTGIWERPDDLLKIEFKRVSEDVFRSDIVEDGKEKFPCDVNDLPIYRNIKHLRGSIWTCDYLIVTMGSCAKEYEEGIIKIISDEEMQVHCGSFGTKTYRRLQARYDR